MASDWGAGGGKKKKDKREGWVACCIAEKARLLRPLKLEDGRPGDGARNALRSQGRKCSGDLKWDKKGKSMWHLQQSSVQDPMGEEGTKGLQGSEELKGLAGPEVGGGEGGLGGNRRRPEKKIHIMDGVKGGTDIIE